MGSLKRKKYLRPVVNPHAGYGVSVILTSLRKVVKGGSLGNEGNESDMAMCFCF